MKKILFTLFCLLPLNVMANSILVSCDVDVIKDNNLKCFIEGNSNEIVTAVSARVRTGNNISFVSFVPSSSWQGDGAEGKIDLYTEYDMTGKFQIGELNFSAKSLVSGGNTDIIIESIFFYDENGLEIPLSSVTKTLRIASDIRDLSNLIVSNGKLNPSFDKNVISYSTTFDASSVTIDASAASSYSKVSGDIGKKSLNYGNNTFNIIVTSEVGKTKTYTINVLRPNNNTNNNLNNNSSIITKSNNTNLKSISLSSGNIDFNKDTTEYNITVSYEIIKVDVIAIPEDSKARVEIDGNDNLSVGSNRIEITVIAEDNTAKTYTIEVVRKEENNNLSNNNYISSINIKDYKLNFNKNIFKYTIRIKNEKKLDIDVLLDDTTAGYEIKGNNNLNDGSLIKIIVTAEDGSIRIYEINIKTNDKIIKSIFIVIIVLLLIVNILRLFFKYKNKKNL